MRKNSLTLAISAIFYGALAVNAYAAPPAHANNNKQAIEHLKKERGGTKVTVSQATGTANFVRLPPGLVKKAGKAKSKNDITLEFLSKHGEAFGLNSGSADLKLRKTERDKLGQEHLSYTQDYAGLPVFGASLKAHFDSDGQLSAITGTLVPDIDVSIAATRSAEEAAEVAIQKVKFDAEGADVSARNSRVLVFRAGLAQGIPGKSHLAYEVEVSNGVNIREFVYIDAHTGKFIDQITGTMDNLDRRVYDAAGGDFSYVLSIWPNSPSWVEGDPLPTTDVEADNMIYASEETYNLFSNAFGRDSFDGAGAKMDSIFNRGYSCPNASWNGAFISFCAGLTTDDVTGHEWGHAYTDYTDDLIYRWQPGALNESYSDVVGETVDRINGRDDIVAPNARTDNSCTIYAGSQPPVLTISGGGADGVYFSKVSVNEPALPLSVGPLPMAQANPADGCSPMDDLSGQIAIIDWEINGAPAVCGSGTRAANAISANAAGIIFVGPASGLLNLGSNSGIASVQVSNSDGESIKGGLPADATIEINLGSDNSVDWLLGEDSTAPGLVGALRDMYMPTCMGDPGKVSDPVYHCSASDNGGVHSNSGVPNHAFSLLVDGGNYNGQSINSIGLTKANHILFRAKTHYQGPATDFVGHADALELSCADLTGTDLASLTTGLPSGEVISAADCEQLSKALLAVEMRSPPVQCGFVPLLAKNPPPLCDSPSKSRKVLFTDSFDNGKSSTARWDTSHFAVSPNDFTERDWFVTGNLPDNRAGQAFFGEDPNYGTCAEGGDESAVLHLDSPQITIPASTKNLRMAFDHWIATEDGYDGGNIKISVNGGEWVVVNPADFIYNPYNINNTFGVNFIPGDPYTTNPIGWEAGHFSGADQGSLGGSWGQSIIDLAPYAVPKDKIRLRFDMGTDGCSGLTGWYVDDVSVYECR